MTPKSAWDCWNFEGGIMAKWKRTKPNKPRTETCEVPDCNEKPTCVLGGFWFCAKHGNRDYEKSNENCDSEERS